jgi:hypothetical protein
VPVELDLSGVRIMVTVVPAELAELASDLKLPGKALAPVLSVLDSPDSHL